MDLTKLGIDELKKLETEIYKEMKLKYKPRMLMSGYRDYKNLEDLCVEYIDSISNNEVGSIHKNIEICIFEAAMEGVFGKDVWEWIDRNKGE